MMERFKDKNSYKQWSSQSLMDYCAFGLLPENEAEQLVSRSQYVDLLSQTEGGGRFCLACPPTIEAATYAGSAETSEVKCLLL
jgi:hypothetical protein